MVVSDVSLMRQRPPESTASIVSDLCFPEMHATDTYMTLIELSEKNNEQWSTLKSVVCDASRSKSVSLFPLAIAPNFQKSERADGVKIATIVVQAVSMTHTFEIRAITLLTSANSISKACRNR
jgi:preprotein translocase subunit Sec63